MEGKCADGSSMVCHIKIKVEKTTGSGRPQTKKTTRLSAEIREKSRSNVHRSDSGEEQENTEVNSAQNGFGLEQWTSELKGNSGGNITTINIFCTTQQDTDVGPLPMKHKLTEEETTSVVKPRKKIMQKTKYMRRKCDKTFKTERWFQAHLTSCEETPGKFKEKTSEEKDEEVEGRKVMKRRTGYQCENCNLTFNAEKRYLVHIGECCKEFVPQKRAFSLQRLRMRSAHKSRAYLRKSVAGTICEIRFLSKPMLQFHMATPTKLVARKANLTQSPVLSIINRHTNRKISAKNVTQPLEVKSNLTSIYATQSIWKWMRQIFSTDVSCVRRCF